MNRKLIIGKKIVLSFIFLMISFIGFSQDADLDGVNDINDNCINTYNPTQLDADNDGIGDICDCLPTTSNPGGSSTPGIMISSNPIMPIANGMSVSFSSVITNGGSSPIYNWKVNGITVGTNSSTFSSSILGNTDVVSCSLTNNVTCILSNPITIITTDYGNVGVGTISPVTSAQLDVSSKTKGFLPPRMATAQRDAIVSPVAGLMIWNQDCLEIQVYNGITWTNMIGGSTCTQTPVSTICNQQWSIKNLDVDHYRNGDIIPEVTDPVAWNSLTTGAWCYYNNDPANNAVYGKLYNWYAVNDARGLAPTGWHIPSDAEWTTLTNCLGGIAIAGGKMKEAGTTHWESPNTGANNSSGFTGLPGSYRNLAGLFEPAPNGKIGTWWTSTAYDATDGIYYFLYYINTYATPHNNHKLSGYAVRCIKD